MYLFELQILKYKPTWWYYLFFSLIYRKIHFLIINRVQVTRFYRDEIGEYWGFDRKLVEDQYQTVAFPFENVAYREFEFIQEWSLDDFLGYLKTWSAVKRFEKENGSNPVDDWTAKFAELWGDSVTRKVITPVFLRIGEKP